MYRSFPPLQTADSVTDSGLVQNQVRTILQTQDWTPLFMPRFKGEWVGIERDRGFAFAQGKVESWSDEFAGDNRKMRCGAPATARTHDSKVAECFDGMNQPHQEHQRHDHERRKHDEDADNEHPVASGRTNGLVRVQFQVARFIMFDFHAKSNRSPTIGITPVSTSMTTFSTIRACTIFGTRIRNACRTMTNEKSGVAMSPRPGMSPMIGSSPNRIRVPGT
jgi:hypothetical protein